MELHLNVLWRVWGLGFSIHLGGSMICYLLVGPVEFFVLRSAQKGGPNDQD